MANVKEKDMIAFLPRLPRKANTDTRRTRRIAVTRRLGRHTLLMNGLPDAPRRRITALRTFAGLGQSPAREVPHRRRERQQAQEQRPEPGEQRRGQEARPRRRHRLVVAELTACGQAADRQSGGSSAAGAGLTTARRFSV